MGVRPLLFLFILQSKIESRKEFTVVDWNKIKAEYISGGTSYRKLAKKYEKDGVTFPILQKKARQEKWTNLRKQAEDKGNTKIVNDIATKQANTGLKINVVANKLIAKLEASIEKLDVIDGGSLKSYTSALKDLKEITNSKSDIDLREQEARIKKLEKEAEDNSSESKEITVIFNGDIDKYSK